MKTFKQHVRENIPFPMQAPVGATRIMWTVEFARPQHVVGWKKELPAAYAEDAIREAMMDAPAGFFPVKAYPRDSDPNSIQRMNPEHVQEMMRKDRLPAARDHYAKKSDYHAGKSERWLDLLDATKDKSKRTTIRKKAKMDIGYANEYGRKSDRAGRLLNKFNADSKLSREEVEVSEARLGGEKYRGKDNPNRRNSSAYYADKAKRHEADRDIHGDKFNAGVNRLDPRARAGSEKEKTFKSPATQKRWSSAWKHGRKSVRHDDAAYAAKKLSREELEIFEMRWEDTARGHRLSHSTALLPTGTRISAHAPHKNWLHKDWSEHEEPHYSVISQHKWKDGETVPHHVVVNGDAGEVGHKFRAHHDQNFKDFGSFEVTHRNVKAHELPPGHHKLWVFK
jgi:hypothetical protein